MKMVITFHSGAQVRVDVTKYEVSTQQMTGELQKLRWTTPDGWGQKLMHVALNQVACIHTEQDQEPDAGDLPDSGRAWRCLCGALVEGDPQGSCPSCRCEIEPGKVEARYRIVEAGVHVA